MNNCNEIVLVKNEENFTHFSRNPPYVSLVITEAPSTPFEIFHIDLFYFDSKDFPTMIDSFFKFTQTIPIPGKTPVNVIV